MRKSVVKDRVQRYLLQKLATGEWVPGQVLPSLRKVSYELRVSHQPVYLVWQEAVAQGLLTRNAREEAIVTDKGPDLARTMLADLAHSNKLKRLAILQPHVFSVPPNPQIAPLQYQLVLAVSAAATARGYKSRIIQLQETDQLQQAAAVVHGYDAAFIVELSPQYLPVVTHLTESGLPTLMYQRKIPGVSIPSLTTDDCGAAKRLVELFANNGHRNISFITSLHADTIMDERNLAWHGWMEALESTGIMPTCVMPLLFDRGGQTVLIDKLIALRPRITGLVVSTPQTLIQLSKLPHFAGIRVPEDLSVASISTVGQVNFPAAFPPITCFDVDWSRAGQCAIEMIDKMISGQTPPKNLRVPLQLRLTESIGPAPSGADA